jgi:hypothetical protein
MMEFYKQYVDPTSVQCAKLVVHLNSQVRKSSESNGEASITPSESIATDDVGIRKHLLDELKVNEGELDDAVGLWRKISELNDRSDKVNDSVQEADKLIEIDDLEDFKASLDALNPPTVDLRQFEWHESSGSRETAGENAVNYAK